MKKVMPSILVCRGLLTVCACLGGGWEAVAAPLSSAEPGLLPLPQSVTWGGQAIPLTAVRIVMPSGQSDPVKREGLASDLEALFGERSIRVDPRAAYFIALRLGPVEAPRQETEAYRLQVNHQGITITANAIPGLFYGVQTLRQLLVQTHGRTTVAACEIHDFPAFKVRGFMHDVGRNFQSLGFLKKQIDVMAAYKLNVFHWHLADHHGWRLESRRHPGLTEDRSFSRDVGRFYTQGEFRDFLDYCWARNITVIPELDSPGHSEAFRKGMGVDHMRDPRAKQAMVELIHELCSLGPPERMPYIHLGTDEVRHPAEQVDGDYLPALHQAVHRNGREVIGWWKGMSIAGDTRQVQQTWAQAQPRQGNRHIDSRSNYVNHLEALDAAVRLFFQQPCRVPHGDDINLGGILCYWPDIRIADQRAGIRNSPVLLGLVAYAEAVWKGVSRDHPEYWAKLPDPASPQYAAYLDFEDRLADQRDRFLSATPFLFVKTAHIPWRLLGPIGDEDVPGLVSCDIQAVYEVNGTAYGWSEPVYGGAIHLRHFFGFPSHLATAPQANDVVWAHTYMHSDRAREVGAWINFNTTSTSDNRAGASRAGHWNINPLCNIWVNGEAVPPPAWKHPGEADQEHPLTDEIYTSRPPSRIQLRQGWNTVLVRAAPHWKWVFTFTPVEWNGTIAREVDGLHFSSSPPPGE